MRFSVGRKLSRLPKRFPVGTIYVIEGRGSEIGHFRVLSRYVVLPGGRRIALGEDFGGPATRRLCWGGRSPSGRKAGRTEKGRLRRVKKIMAGAGTPRRGRR